MKIIDRIYRLSFDSDWNRKRLLKFRARPSWRLIKANDINLVITNPRKRREENDW